jgi:hypothetical protein
MACYRKCATLSPKDRPLQCLPAVWRLCAVLIVPPEGALTQRAVSCSCSLHLPVSSRGERKRSLVDSREMFSERLQHAAFAFRLLLQLIQMVGE